MDNNARVMVRFFKLLCRVAGHIVERGEGPIFANPFYSINGTPAVTERETMRKNTIRRILGEVSTGWDPADRKDLQEQLADIESVVELFPAEGAGQKVLDIGLERGFKAIPLAKSGYEVHGLDFAADRIAAREKDFYRPHSIAVTACDVTEQRIPHPDGTFDYVMLNGVLEHWYCSPLFALGEIHRVLKPGGKFILQTPNAANLRKRVWLALGRYPYVPLESIHSATHPHAFHHREHTIKELAWLVDKAGFFVDRKLYRDCFHRSSPTWPKRFYWGVTQIIPPFRDMLIIVAHK